MNKIERYLIYFDRFFEDSTFLQRHPILSSEYQYIRNEFIDLAEYDTKKEPVVYISDLLSVDAKLQTLYELCQCLDALSLNDNEIISIVKNDRNYYYLENFGKAKNDHFPYSLLFFNNFVGKNNKTPVCKEVKNDVRKTPKKTIFIFFLLSLFFLNPTIIHGQNLESTNIVARLGFTGVYESPLSPMPQPPNGVQPENDSIEKFYSSKTTLPKLSDSTALKLKLLGIIILLVLLFLLLAKRKEEYINENDSISSNDIFNGNTFS